ncbi:MAG TPA: HU family DNA-binding protein [Bacteroidota bacterium]|nr:HU family DNA-binding protein [Bacteroidota bacterium]
MKTYTKKDIAVRVAQALGQPHAVAKRWVDSVFNALRATMMNGDDELRIEVREFGVFEIKKTKSKPKARNPRTGEIIVVPPHRKSHFKPGKILKQYLSKATSDESKE